MNKRNVVVVGASRGIGEAMVARLAKSDSTVFALSRNVKRMELSFSPYPNVTCHSFDLSEDVRRQAELLFDKIGKIDVLINNAGLLINKPFDQLTHGDIKQSYQVNVIGVMETVQAALPYLCDGGHIVNISSMGGVQGTVKFPGLAAYSTSKAALCSFTELFAEEFKYAPFQMNCLALGAAQTEMLEEAFPGYQAPLKADEMAAFVVDFALNGNKWFNGKILPVALSTP
jgi:NAD(P)-dependent dehydrogenase (short-subunit alcohol dehydrogenase family)